MANAKHKKTDYLTTTGSQKTNYLKTNLLKQIKKISFTQKSLILYCTNRLLICTVQNYNDSACWPKFLHKKTLCTNKNTTKRGWKTKSIPLIVKFA